MPDILFLKTRKTTKIKKALTNVAIPLARDNLLGFCKQLKPQMQEINLRGK